MKALVKTAPGVGHVEICDVPEPTPGPGTVKCEVKYCGICGTDIHIYHGRWKEPPFIMGHEWSGVVVETGPGVESVQAGNRVTGIPLGPTCGRCHYCLEGHPFMCSDRIGFTTPDNGAFSKYVIALESTLRRLPDNVSFEAAALMEPLACVVKAVVFVTGISAGEVVLLTGPGPIGLLTLQVAKAEGSFVVLAGTSADAERLEIGKRLGADATINVETDDVEGILQGLTNGYGPDVVLECSGALPAVRMGVDVIRKEGTLTQIGVLDHNLEFDFMTAFLKDLRVNISYASTYESWDRALTLVSRGQVKLEPLVTDILPLSEWEKGFEKINNREGLKILLYPEE